MTFYVCEKCGLVIEKICGPDEKMMCCHEEMEKLSANTKEAATEKHMPTVEFEKGQLKVCVGENIHPMESGHFISFIQVELDQQILRQHLKPENEPIATFEIGNYHGKVSVYSYCNLHGLWKTELVI